MAITIDNKTYRNLEEQVLKNKEDIARHYEIDRVLSDWGIKVLGVYASADLLPTENNEFGDAYAVGVLEPYTYYIWTRANTNVGQENDYWLNVGALSIVGPQGPQGRVGPIGPQGVRGSKWFSGTVAPTYIASLHNISDMYINGTTGDVYQLMSNNVWQLFGNIRGPQGVQGPVGPRGIQGIQGPAGPQGAKGDTGASFQIGGLLESSDLLPTPTESNRYLGYAVKNADGVTYDLYVVVGTDTLMWVNMGRVEGVEGPQGPVGPQGPAGADIQVVYITGIPETSTQGTLTQDQVNTLLAHPSNYIQFFNENFYPQDVETDEGYIVYSHVGLYEGNTIVKTITLTLATLSWVLSTLTLQDTLESGTNIKTINGESILGSGNIEIQGGGGTTTKTINGTLLSAAPTTINVIEEGWFGNLTSVYIQLDEKIENEENTIIYFESLANNPIEIPFSKEMNCFFGPISSNICCIPFVYNDIQYVCMIGLTSGAPLFEELSDITINEIDAQIIKYMVIHDLFILLKEFGRLHFIFDAVFEGENDFLAHTPLCVNSDDLEAGLCAFSIEINNLVLNTKIISY